MAGLATEADWVFIPESPFDTEEESWETILCRNLTIVIFYISEKKKKKTLFDQKTIKIKIKKAKSNGEKKFNDFNC